MKTSHYLLAGAVAAATLFSLRAAARHRFYGRFAGRFDRYGTWQPGPRGCYPAPAGRPIPVE